MSVAKYFLTKPCSTHFAYLQCFTAKFKLIYIMKKNKYLLLLPNEQMKQIKTLKVF